jgi:tetratricopeptide (TPR) repeat protein
MIAELPKRVEAELARVTQAIDSARTMNPVGGPGELFIERARLNRLLGRHRDALVDLREALACGAEPRANIFCEIGATSLDLDDEGKDIAAIDAFSNAIDLAPSMERAYIGRALAYENLGNLASAAADFDVIIPRAANPAELLEKRGQWRLALGRYTEALADFDAAAALGHEPLDLLTGRGVALRELGDHAASLDALTSAVDRYPDAVVARTYRATALLAAGDINAALADLDRIIDHSADHWKAPAAFSIRAALRAQRGDHSGAVRDVEEAIARWQGTPPAEWVSFVAEIRTKLQPDTDGA